MISKPDDFFYVLIAKQKNEFIIKLIRIKGKYEISIEYYIGTHIYSCGHVCIERIFCQ